MKRMKWIYLSALFSSFVQIEHAFAETPTCDGILQLQTPSQSSIQPQLVRTQVTNYNGLTSQKNLDQYPQNFNNNDILPLVNYNVIAGTNFTFTLVMYADNNNTAPACSFTFDYHLAPGMCNVIPFISTITVQSSSQYTCTAGDPEDVTPVYGAVLKIEKNFNKGQST